jgi:hypothetical protein
VTVAVPPSHHTARELPLKSARERTDIIAACRRSTARSTARVICDKFSDGPTRPDAEVGQVAQADRHRVTARASRFAGASGSGTDVSTWHGRGQPGQSQSRQAVSAAARSRAIPASALAARPARACRSASVRDAVTAAMASARDGGLIQPLLAGAGQAQRDPAAGDASRAVPRHRDRLDSSGSAPGPRPLSGAVLAGVWRVRRRDDRRAVGSSRGERPEKCMPWRQADIYAHADASRHPGLIVMPGW